MIVYSLFCEKAVMSSLGEVVGKLHFPLIFLLFPTTISLGNRHLQTRYTKLCYLYAYDYLPVPVHNTTPLKLST